MKKKDLMDLRKKDINDLFKMVSDKKTDLIKVKTQLSVGKEKNLKKAKNINHDLSQIKTLIREKKLMEKVITTDQKDVEKEAK
jgi:ribosomal protein L29